MAYTYLFFQRNKSFGPFTGPIVIDHGRPENLKGPEAMASLKKQIENLRTVAGRTLGLKCYSLWF